MPRTPSREWLILSLSLIGAAGCGGLLGEDVDAGTHRPVDAATQDAPITDARVIADAPPPDAWVDAAPLPDAADWADARSDSPITCTSESTYAGELVAAIDDQIIELSAQGTELRRYSVPAGGPAGDVNEYLRGLFVGPCGGLYVYQGTFAASLAIRQPGLATWEYRGLFSTSNNQSGAGLAGNSTHIFVTDNGAAAGTHAGITAIRISDGATTRSAELYDPFDVGVGGNGLVYALTVSGNLVHILDPATLSAITELHLDARVISVAITPQGIVYGGDGFGTIYKFRQDGLVIGSLDLGTNVRVADVAIAPDGTIAVGSTDGDLFLTDVSLSAFTRVSLGANPVTVTFTEPGVVVD